MKKALLSIALVFIMSFLFCSCAVDLKTFHIDGIYQCNSPKITIITNRDPSKIGDAGVLIDENGNEVKIVIQGRLGTARIYYADDTGFPINDDFLYRGEYEIYDDGFILETEQGITLVFNRIGDVPETQENKNAGDSSLSSD